MTTMWTDCATLCGRFRPAWNRSFRESVSKETGVNGASEMREGEGNVRKRGKSRDGSRDGSDKAREQNRQEREVE